MRSTHYFISCIIHSGTLKNAHIFFLNCEYCKFVIFYEKFYHPTVMFSLILITCVVHNVIAPIFVARVSYQNRYIDKLIHKNYKRTTYKLETDTFKTLKQLFLNMRISDLCVFKVPYCKLETDTFKNLKQLFLNYAHFRFVRF